MTEQCSWTKRQRSLMNHMMDPKKVKDPVIVSVMLAAETAKIARLPANHSQLHRRHHSCLISILESAFYASTFKSQKNNKIQNN